MIYAILKPDDNTLRMIGYATVPYSSNDASEHVVEVEESDLDAIDPDWRDDPGVIVLDGLERADQPLVSQDRSQALGRLAGDLSLRRDDTARIERER